MTLFVLVNRKYNILVAKTSLSDTGPNEITIFDPEGLQRLDGPGNKNTKSVFYDFLLPNVGIETIRDKAWHDERRRIWTKAFSTRSIHTRYAM